MISIQMMIQLPPLNTLVMELYEFKNPKCTFYTDLVNQIFH